MASVDVAAGWWRGVRADGGPRAWPGEQVSRLSPAVTVGLGASPAAAAGEAGDDADPGPRHRRRQWARRQAEIDALEDGERWDGLA
ncbi:MAG: hypothetical protein ACK4PI_09110 [Tepidisphaerales bacterium]